MSPDLYIFKPRKFNDTRMETERYFDVGTINPFKVGFGN
jgi:hypothetical protein